MNQKKIPNKEEIFKRIKEYKEEIETYQDLKEEQQEEITDGLMEIGKSLKWQKKVWLSILACIVFFSSLIFISAKYIPHLTLKGASKITINYKEKYKEPGYTLKIGNKLYNKDVKVNGKVNPNKLGKYQITYIYKKGMIERKKIRTVYVKDQTKPVVLLNGPTKVYICPNKKYQEEGYKVLDNYDQDLTKKVKIEKTESSYTYTIKDHSNNKASITRKIYKSDRTAPKITLKNGEFISIPIGTTYQEEGYQAQDNCDGDITSSVEISGQVDSNTLGSYVITYTVRDKENNKTSVKRTINVVNKSAPGTIYLTFDDGPRSGTTDKILDILKEENVKATFFVTNSGPDDLIKREYLEGHTVGLHTATHDYSLIYSSKASYFSDLKSVQDRVERITGNRSKIIRFPGGSSNTISRKYKEHIMSELTKEVLSQGFKYYDWNISSGDAGETTSKTGVYNYVTKNLSKDKVNIILMHDTKPHTRDALKEIIEYGKKNGYTFDAINEFTEMMMQKVNN